MSINLAPQNDFRKIGEIDANQTINQNLSLMVGWYATDTTTVGLTGLDLIATYGITQGLYCRQVEDVNHTGKAIPYLEWYQADSDTTRQFLPAAGEWNSGIQPIIRKLVYDSSNNSPVKMYFNRFDEGRNLNRT